LDKVHPMNPFFILCMALAVASVLAVLGLGIFSMVKGGDFNKKYGNRLMQARVALQGLALLLLALAYFTSRT
jgi:hypothetical protein